MSLRDPWGELLGCSGGEVGSHPKEGFMGSSYGKRRPEKAAGDSDEAWYTSAFCRPWCTAYTEFGLVARICGCAETRTVDVMGGGLGLVTKMVPRLLGRISSSVFLAPLDINGMSFPLLAVPAPPGFGEMAGEANRAILRAPESPGYLFQRPGLEEVGTQQGRDGSLRTCRLGIKISRK